MKKLKFLFVMHVIHSDKSKKWYLVFQNEGKDHISDIQIKITAYEAKRLIKESNLQLSHSYVDGKYSFYE